VCVCVYEFADVAEVEATVLDEGKQRDSAEAARSVRRASRLLSDDVALLAPLALQFNQRLCFLQLGAVKRISAGDRRAPLGVGNLGPDRTPAVACVPRSVSESLDHRVPKA